MIKRRPFAPWLLTSTVLAFACTLPSKVSLADEPIVVEAENFAQQTRDERRRWHVLRAGEKLPDLPGVGTEKLWLTAQDSAAATAGGNAFVRLLPDTRTSHADKLIRGENFSPQPGQMAILKYPITIEKPGRYYIWVRAFSTGTEDNGIHVGVDGRWPETGQRMQWCEGKGGWRWECAQRTEENHCGEPMQIYLDIDEPGRHVVQFSMREDGFAFDQFLLSSEISYRPSGATPEGRAAK